ncbi:MAG: hypothetical protein AAFV33_11800 [Chloroflexota bacterium]
MSEQKLTPQLLAQLKELAAQGEMKVHDSDGTQQQRDLMTLTEMGLAISEETSGAGGIRGIFTVSEKGQQVLAGQTSQATDDATGGNVTKIIMLPNLRKRLKDLLTGPMTLEMQSDEDRQAVKDYRELLKPGYVTETEGDTDGTTLVFTITDRGRAVVEK